MCEEERRERERDVHDQCIPASHIAVLLVVRPGGVRVLHRRPRARRGAEVRVAARPAVAERVERGPHVRAAHGAGQRRRRGRRQGVRVESRRMAVARVGRGGALAPAPEVRVGGQTANPLRREGRRATVVGRGAARRAAGMPRCSLEGRARQRGAGLAARRDPALLCVLGDALRLFNAGRSAARRYPVRAGVGPSTKGDQRKSERRLTGASTQRWARWRRTHMAHGLGPSEHCVWYFCARRERGLRQADFAEGT